MMFGVNILTCLVVMVGLVGVMVWDLTSGHQTLTGRCVWAAGYCLWIG